MSTLKLILVVTTLYHGIGASTRKGVVTEYRENLRFTCPGKQINTARSELQCVHRCLRKDNCGLANYKGSIGDAPMADNCEVFDALSNNESCSSIDSLGWKGLVLAVRQLKLL